jgi:lipid-A-disaccharide synthase
MKPKIFISCGELSGENHVIGLIRELNSSKKDLEIKAFASEQVAKEGIELLEDYQNYSFSGISEVISNIKTILDLQKRLLDKLRIYKPDLVLLVDYGGFNLELAKRIRQCPELKQTKIIEFIAPQIWASRPWRINKIKKNIDKVLCTLAFEEEIYQKENIAVRYVGNPVYNSLAPASTKEELYKEINLDSKLGHREVLIGIFPGSRKSEINEMLPRMLKAAKELSEEMPSIKFRFIVSQAKNIKKESFTKLGIDKYTDLISILDASIQNSNHKLLSAADALWLCSGTVTLEAALYGTPYFLAYRSNFFNYLIYLIFRIGSMAGLANIIQGRYIVKEFLQYQANTKNFKFETKLWLRKDSPSAFTGYYYEIENNLKRLKNDLSKHNTYKLVSEEILKCLF